MNAAAPSNATAPSAWSPVIGVGLAHRGGWAMIILTTLGLIITGLLQPWPLALLVDGVLRPADSPPAVIAWAQSHLPGAASPAGMVNWIVAAQIALFAASASLEALSAYLWVKVGQRATYDLSECTFAAMLRRSIVYHTRSPVGDSLQRVLGDAYVAQTAISLLLVRPVAAAFAGVSVGLAMWQMNSLLAVVVIASAPAMAWGTYLVRKPARQIGKKASQLSGQLSAHVQQAIVGLPLVQTYGRADDETRRFAAMADDVMRNKRHHVWVSHGAQFLAGIVPTIAVAVVIWLGAKQVLAGRLLLGELLVFLGYANTLKNKFADLANMVTSLQLIRGQAERVAETIHAKPEVGDLSAEPFPETAVGHLSLRNVTFGYNPDQPVLRDLSLDIPAGTTLALVGETGSGKSTLASLALRLIDPQQGSIALDGQDLREFSLADYRRHTAWVSQEPLLLPMSVEANVTLGLENVSAERVAEALDQAQAAEFVDKLDGKTQTVLSERGNSLSGGQRQRLAIARAFVRQAKVVVLDEPTSALDARTERQIMDSFQALSSGRTSLIIAHRLSTIQGADQIAVLAGGSVAELGSHDELLKRGGIYAGLWQAQMKTGQSEVSS